MFAHERGHDEHEVILVDRKLFLSHLSTPQVMSNCITLSVKCKLLKVE